MIAHRLCDKYARGEPITIENFVIDMIIIMGTIPLRLKENLRTIGVDTSIELIQRSVLLG